MGLRPMGVCPTRGHGGGPAALGLGPGAGFALPSCMCPATVPPKPQPPWLWVRLVRWMGTCTDGATGDTEWELAPRLWGGGASVGL